MGSKRSRKSHKVDTKGSGSFDKGISPGGSDEDPVRWNVGDPIDAGYYDAPLPTHIPNTKDEADNDSFPPDGIDLSDAWVLEIVNPTYSSELTTQYCTSTSC